MPVRSTRPPMWHSTRRAVTLGMVAALGMARIARAQPLPVEHAYGPGPKQSFDLYHLGGPGPAPCIVMLHGGGWSAGDKANSAVWRAKWGHWGPRGYAFISVNTRLMPEASALEQARDLATALAYIQREAGALGIDRDRIVLMGHSAGAHIAALVSSDSALQQAAGLRRWTGSVFLDTATYDVEALMTGTPGWLYHRVFGADPAYWARVSPMARLSAGMPPCLVVSSSRRSEAFAQAQAFTDRVQALGGDARLLPVDLSHGEINSLLGENSDYTQAVDDFLGSIGLP